MPGQQAILSIDQGTSGTKAIILGNGKVLSRGQRALKSSYPKPGYVEQDPEEIYQNVLGAVKECLTEFESNGADTHEIISCGISNQRETFVLWDGDGNPLHNAVVWQCKRSIAICDELREKGFSKELNQKTGLIIDPYFSGSKVIHLIRHNEKVKAALDRGDCYFGTVDSWLLFKLTEGRSYLTDYTNACRTMFFNITSLSWDRELLAGFELEKLNLPAVKPSTREFGKSEFEGLFSKPIPITGMVGDSHAAAIGEKVFEKGMAKVTLGTGSSILWNTGTTPVFSNNGLVTTICWSLGDRVNYALEGVIVSCGSIIEWLKNQLGLFADSSLTEKMARSVPDNGGVAIVPAFSGLGAPYWQMNARAAITGLTFGSTKEHIALAALEAIAFQVKDITALMEKESSAKLTVLKANGGLTKNHFVMELINDLLNGQVSVSSFPDISALGAGLVAGMGAGVYRDLSDLEQVGEASNRIEFRDQKVADLTLNNYESWKEIVKNYIKIN